MLDQTYITEYTIHVSTKWRYRKENIGKSTNVHTIIINQQSKQLRNKEIKMQWNPKELLLQKPVCVGQSDILSRHVK
jgi:hypothetical protein